MPFPIRACLAACTAFAVATAAQAETVTKTLDGTRLELRLSCLKSATIDPDAGLHGKIEVEASADRPDELDALTFSGGGTARIERTGSCSTVFHDREPSLALVVKVPAATPIDLHASGSGRYRIGKIGAALAVEGAGSAEIAVDQTTDLDLDISGSGELTLRRLDGPGKVRVTGSGTVTIDAGVTPSFAVDVRGSGNVKVGSGEIGTLAASTAGSGDIHVGGTVKDAALATTGSGNIDIAKVTGNVSRRTTGSGTIHTGS
jgi:hypothetical protein